MHAPRPQTWHERFGRAGYLIGAILFHLILFLMVATVVVWNAPKPPSAEFQPVRMQAAPPPPPQPPSSGAAANNPELEPQSVVVPVATPMAAITTANSTFRLDAAKILDQSLSHLNLPNAQGSGLSTGGGGASGAGGGFGSATGSDAELTGYFYDLKQTNQKAPTKMTQKAYLDFLRDYVHRGWDDSMLDPYYKSKSPLFTDCFAISTRPSGEAPKAFSLQNEVQPGLWIVHYRGKVMAPEAGDYRLAGFGDNVLLVKIGGTTVLDGGWDSLSPTPNLHESLPFRFPSYMKSASAKRGNNPSLKIGISFHMDTAESMDMDVLIGDCGGVCSFFLLVEKVGANYEQAPDGTPKLPFFQISTKAPPSFKPNEEHPPYSLKPELWQSAPN